MITGKDVVLYILSNNLEDKPVFTDGEIMGFYTIDKFAEMCGYGIETVKAKIQMGQIKGAISIGDTYLIANHEYVVKEYFRNSEGENK